MRPTFVRVLLSIGLCLVILTGQSGNTQPALAQGQTTYKLTKIITCADDINRDFCQSSQGLDIRKGPDGSVIGTVKGGTSQNSCQFVLNLMGLGGGGGGFLFQCPQGTARYIFQIPPWTTWDSSATSTFSAVVDASGAQLHISGRFWLSPAGAFQQRPGGTGESGGIVPPGDLDPFTYIGADTADKATHVSYDGAVGSVSPAPGLEKWSVGIAVSAFSSAPGVNSTSMGTGVEYVWEAIPAGQIPPNNNPPDGNPPGNNPSDNNPPNNNNPPTTGGATNSTLPMPPFGQAEPMANTPGMTLQAAQRRVAAGDLVFLPVYLIKANNVANINFDMTYNPNVVQPEGTSLKGSLLDNAIISVNPNTNGTIRIGFAQSSGVSGTGTVVYVPFRAVGKVNDRTGLALTVTTINQPDGNVPPIDRIPGEIIIIGPGQATPGDCYGDGSLDERDAECALDMSTGLRAQNQVMDIDSSGEVTSRDATLILQSILENLGLR